LSRRLNPYASHLGELDPLEVIATTPEKLRALMDAIGGQRAEQPRALGKWSAREIVCHLADCEVVFAFACARRWPEIGTSLRPFDQEAWVKRYAGYSVEAALATFSALRQWNPGAGAVVRRRGPGAARESSRTRRHDARKDGHDRHLLKQVEEIARLRNGG
jgi:hypothetical protein